jgi:hypothetical protein
MDFNYVAMLLGIVHSAQDVDPWFGQAAKMELNRIKVEFMPKPEPVPVPKAIPAKQADPEYDGLERPKSANDKRSL